MVLIGIFKRYPITTIVLAYASVVMTDQIALLARSLKFDDKFLSWLGLGFEKLLHKTYTPFMPILEKSGLSEPRMSSLNIWDDTTTPTFFGFILVLSFYGALAFAFDTGLRKLFDRPNK